MKQEVILFQEDTKFNKPGMLIQISKTKELSISCLKVYNFIVRKFLNENNQDKNIITTNISEIAANIGTTKRNEILNHLKKLKGTDFIKEYQDKETKKTRVFETNLITSLDYFKEDTKLQQKDWIQIELSSKLHKQLLIDSKKLDYGKLDLEEVKRIKGNNTLILYEIFVKHIGTYEIKKLKLSEKQIRKFTNTQKKYLNLSEFTRNVIKKPLQEVNQKTILNVQVIRKKENGENFYTFTINQGVVYNFNLWKQTIIICNDARSNSFDLGEGVFIYKDLEDKNPQNLLVQWNKNKTNWKTITTVNSEKIWTKFYTNFKSSPKKYLDQIGLTVEDFESVYLSLKKKKEKI